jgi:hypothetical protein
MADGDDILLNSREVPFLLDMSPDKVDEFARRNILPAFKQGPQWLAYRQIKSHPRWKRLIASTLRRPVAKAVPHPALQTNLCANLCTESARHGFAP